MDSTNLSEDIPKITPTASLMPFSHYSLVKALHWLCVVDEEGRQILSRRVEATEEGIASAREELDRWGGEGVAVGVDMTGGPAALLVAMLAERGEWVFYVPGKTWTPIGSRLALICGLFVRIRRR
jgi:Transposase